jgi:4-carboxymuconolactone decarboxylase
MDEKQRYEAGMQVRRAVLGDAHVDNSLKNSRRSTKNFRK